MASPQPPGETATPYVPQTVGRPLAMTPEAQEKFLRAIAGNSSYRGASGFAGFSYQTFLAHRHEHRAARAEGRDTGFSEFFDRVDEAEAIAETKLSASWSTAAETDWRAAQALLRQRHKDEWGETPEVKLEHSGTVEHTGAVTTVVTLPADGDLGSYLGAIAAALDRGRDDAPDVSEDSPTD